MVFIYSNKNPELLDYVTTMWVVIGAIYENIPLRFLLPATLLLIEHNTEHVHSS